MPPSSRWQARAPRSPPRSPRTSRRVVCRLRSFCWLAGDGDLAEAGLTRYRSTNSAVYSPIRLGEGLHEASEDCCGRTEIGVQSNGVNRNAADTVGCGDRGNDLARVVNFPAARCPVGKQVNRFRIEVKG